MLCCFQQLVSYEIAENTQFKILEKKIDFKICPKFLRISKNIHTNNTKHTPNCQKHSKFTKTPQNSSSLWSKKVKKTIMLIAKERLRLIRLAVGCKFAQTCHFADFSSFFATFPPFYLNCLFLTTGSGSGEHIYVYQQSMASGFLFNSKSVKTQFQLGLIIKLCRNIPQLELLMLSLDFWAG